MPDGDNATMSYVPAEPPRTRQRRPHPRRSSDADVVFSITGGIAGLRKRVAVPAASMRDDEVLALLEAIADHPPPASLSGRIMDDMYKTVTIGEGKWTSSHASANAALDAIVKRMVEQ